MKLIDTYKSILLQEYSNKLVKHLLDKFKEESPYLSDEYILKYISKFDQIKDKLNKDKRDISKYDFNELQHVISFVLGHKKEKNVAIEFKNVKPIYNKNNLEIYLANSKRACIYYGMGYNFCISSRGEDNLYHSYRGDYTIYFVFDRNKPIKQYGPNNFVNPDHLLVIMVNKDGEYSVTNADNDDKTPLGLREAQLTWDEILKIQPRLKGLEHLFEYKEQDISDYTIEKLDSMFFDKTYQIYEKYKSLIKQNIEARYPGVTANTSFFNINYITINEICKVAYKILNDEYTYVILNSTFFIRELFDNIIKPEYISKDKKYTPVGVEKEYFREILDLCKKYHKAKQKILK